MAVLRLTGAGICRLLNYTACFLHNLVVLVMFPLLILICLGDWVLGTFLDNLTLPIFWVLFVVRVLAKVVIVVPSTSVVVVVLVATSPVIVGTSTTATFSIPVISIPSIILVIIRVSTICVLIIAIILIVSIVPVVVARIWSWRIGSIKWRLSARVLRSTAIHWLIRV